MGRKKKMLRLAFALYVVSAVSSSIFPFTFASDQHRRPLRAAFVRVVPLASHEKVLVGGQEVTELFSRQNTQTTEYRWVAASVGRAERHEELYRARLPVPGSPSAIFRERWEKPAVFSLH
jgi:hypothetical protein